MSTPKKPRGLDPSHNLHRYTISIPEPLDARIKRAMDLEGVSSFSDFTRSSLTHRCREIERDHGIQQTPEKSS